MFIIFMIFILFWVTACQTPLPESATTARNTTVVTSTKAPVHTIRYSGETLSIIAAWYLEDRNAWPILLQENPGVDSNRLQIGDTLRLPWALVKRRDVLPESFVVSQRAPSRVDAAPARSLPATEVKAVEITPAVPKAAQRPAVTVKSDKPAPASVSVVVPERERKTVENPSVTAKPVVPLPRLFGPREAN